MQTVRTDAPLHTDALRPAPVDPPPPPRWTASRDRAAVAAHGNHPINHLVTEPTRFADRDKAGRPRARTQRSQRSPRGDGDALSKRQPGPTHACAGPPLQIRGSKRGELVRYLQLAHNER